MSETLTTSEASVEAEPENAKACRVCAVTKPLEEFHKSKSMADGLASICKECQREYNRRYYAALKPPGGTTKKSVEDAYEVSRKARKRIAIRDARYEAAQRERNRLSWAEWHHHLYLVASSAASYHAAIALQLGYEEPSEDTGPEAA